MKNRGSLTALAIALALAGCDQTGASPTAQATQTEASQTLAGALNEVEGMDSLSKAISTAELGTVFDGPGSYTVLAPTDAAFTALGEQGEVLFTEEQRPLLVALVREHVLPGHLTPENIAKAIADKDGPVTMTTLGGGSVTFSKDGETISVANDGGAKAVLEVPATAATNGVIIPVAGVLLPPKEA